MHGDGLTLLCMLVLGVGTFWAVHYALSSEDNGEDDGE